MAKKVDIIPAFIEKTYEIINMESYQHMCHWNGDGDAIVLESVSNILEYEKDIYEAYGDGRI